jgi:hypothetical protein
LRLELLEEITGRVGTVAAAVAAVYAVKSLKAAKSTVTLATQQSKDERAARQRRDLVDIGRQVETIATAIGVVANRADVDRRSIVQGHCNHLRNLLIGYESELPACVALRDAAGPSDANSKVSLARREVAMALSGTQR